MILDGKEKCKWLEFITATWIDVAPENSVKLVTQH